MKIINNYPAFTRFNIEEVISNSLKVIPDKHFKDLESITLVNRFSGELHRNYNGRYFKKKKLNLAKIEIAVGEVLNYEYNWLFEFIFSLNNLLLSQELFFQLGHHYAYLTNVTSKKEIKEIASQYRGAMSRKASPFTAKIAFSPLTRWYLKVTED
jgi:hypothetical protein